MNVADVDAAEPVLIGSVGTPGRAWVSPSGDVVRAGDAATLRWFVAAEDRWHVPASEAAVRQRRIDGTPVVETRVRVPEGDAIQRVWSVPDSGGLTVIEVENASALPFAVAFAGTRVLTERPPADVPIRGIDLPEDAIVLPVAHRASVRVAIPHDPDRFSTWALPTLAPAMAVVRGWQTVVHRASRLVLPDAGLGDAVTAARSDLLLAGPVEASDDPVGFLLDVAELGRLGDDADAWMPEIVEPVASIARSDDAEVDLALRACERLAIAAGDDRAAADIGDIRRRRVRDGRSAPSRDATTIVVLRPGARRLGRPVRRRGRASDRRRRSPAAARDPSPMAGLELRGARRTHRAALDGRIRRPLARRTAGAAVGAAR